jgi:hypothetical protein
MRAGLNMRPGDFIEISQIAIIFRTKNLLSHGEIWLPVEVQPRSFGERGPDIIGKPFK